MVCCASIIILGLFLYCEEFYWNFDKDCMESVSHVVYNGHFNNINSSFCIIFNFLHQFFNLGFSFSLLHLFLGGGMVLFFVCLFVFVCDRVSLHFSGWTQTSNSPASTSRKVELKGSPMCLIPDNFL
jgi:hypothetical protein